ncbi:hypothetical protein LTR36_004702 [Oleoguttula mirabilis]|uniref:Uncharacterized protein n=1 Tax=Oleoguttula mirabilis TaxID=1507867 RepID=A0AAV9JGI0_9PEZI|nr:hypothetical protein LTR36_004702 [Oleoguttula mirabilis]
MAAVERVKKLEKEIATAGRQISSLQQQAVEAAFQDVAARTPLPPPTGFISLPAELRDIVYDMCVAKEKIFVRWSSKAASFDVRLERYQRQEESLPEPPQLQVLRLSKQIGIEALKRLLSTNTFYIMPAHHHVPDFRKISSILHGNSDGAGDLPATRLSVAFDTRQYDFNTHYELNLEHVHSDHERNPNQSGSRRREHQHDRAVTSLFDEEWEWLVCGIHGTKCSYLEVNLQNCFCPCQCESLVYRVVERLSHFGRRGGPDAIRFLGVSDADVRWEIRGIFHARRAVTGRDIELSFAAIRKGFGKHMEALWNGVEELADDEERKAEELTMKPLEGRG